MSRVLLVFIVLLSVGCGWLPNRTLDYRKAEPVGPLAMPEGMEVIGEQALYVVPEPARRLEHDPDAEFEVPRPPDLAILGRADETVPDSAEQPDPTNTRVVLARDGSGYPMIMMGTSYAWAWEYVGQALAQTDLEVEDRDRQSGVFYLTVPRQYGLEEGDAQLKLSQTANGIQITVLQPKGGTLVAKGPGQDILQALYDKL